MAQVTNKFSTAVQKAMDEQRVSIKDLVEVTEHSYEHTRRIVKGLAYPSKHMTALIAEKLGLDKNLLWKYATEDKITARYGKTSLVVAGRNPELADIETGWPYLTEEQKNTLKQMVSVFVKTNKGVGSAKSKSA